MAFENASLAAKLLAINSGDTFLGTFSIGLNIFLINFYLFFTNTFSILLILTRSFPTPRTNISN